MPPEPNADRRPHETARARGLWRRLFGPRAAPAHHVVMYRTRACPLCEEALETLEQARRRARFALEVHDITDDPAKLAEHRLEVPVVYVDGRKRFMGRVDPVLLKRLLEREPDA